MMSTKIRMAMMTLNTDMACTGVAGAALFTL